MARSRQNSGYFQNRAGCLQNSKQRPRLGVISHRRTGRGAASVFGEYAGSPVLIKLEIAHALRQLLRASDYPEVCGVVVRNPILLLESAPELLRATIEEAERRGDSTDKDILMRYLKVLELARETAVVAMSKDLNQPE